MNAKDIQGYEYKNTDINPNNDIILTEESKDALFNFLKENCSEITSKTALVFLKNIYTSLEKKIAHQRKICMSLKGIKGVVIPEKGVRLSSLLEEVVKGKKDIENNFPELINNSYINILEVCKNAYTRILDFYSFKKGNN